MANDIQRMDDDDGQDSLPVLLSDETRLRLAYLGYTSIPLTILFDVMSSGQIGGSAAVGLFFGGSAYFWAPQLHKAVGPVLRTIGSVIAYLNRDNSGRKVNRLLNVNWWLGQDITPYAEVAEEEPEEIEEPIPSPQPPTIEDVRSASFHEEHFNYGESFYPHVDTVFSNRLVVLGMPGAGKSNTVAVITEELADFEAPFIIFDQKPEYGRMVDFFPRGYAAGAHNVTVENAFQFGQQMMQERWQVVLNLRSYHDDNVAALVMIRIIKGVWAWQEALINDDRIPCTLILDEAHYWLPQSENLSTVSRVKDKDGRSLFTSLQQAFFNVVNGGRSFGIGIVISTQRPANIDNRAIAVAEWKLLLKANMPHDLKVYRSFGVSDETAMNLAPGQAYIIGPDDIRGVFQLRKRYTPDDAKTPGLAALRKQPSTLSFSSETETPHTFHARNETVKLPEIENESDMKEPLEPDETFTGFNEKDETFIASHEDEIAVLKAAMQLQSEGKTVTREAIKQQLGWNNAKHSVVKAVCDKHKIAVR